MGKLLPYIAVACLCLALMGSREATDLEQYYVQLSDELPDVLACNKFSWLDNCEVINRQAKLNPHAPLRLVDPTGLEFTFAPDTPGVMIEHMLKPSKATARKVIAHQRAHMDRAELAAQMSREVAIELGGVGAQYLVAESASANPVRAIDPTSAKIFVIYRSDSDASRKHLVEVAALAEQFPTLEVNVLQADKNDEFIQRVRSTLKLRAKTLTESEKRRLLPKVDSYPSTWVQETRSRDTKVISGFSSKASLITAIQEAS